MKTIPAVFLATILAGFIPSKASAQRLLEQWRGKDSQRCAVMDCISPSPSPAPPSNNSEGIDTRYDIIHKDAVRVWNEATAYSSFNAKLDSYQYALQLFRQQQALRDGANVRDAISQIETLILWTRGVIDDQNKNYGTAVNELHNAYKSRPELFTEGNYNYIAAVEMRFRSSMPNESARLQFPDPPTVDARDVPSGLSKAVENAIANAFLDSPPGVGDRVRKGFQAVMANDWKVARAWFQDALNRDPGNANLKSFIVSVDLTPGEALDVMRKGKIEKDPLSSLDANATKLSKEQIMKALDAVLLDASCPKCR
jgi:hypothetical protein